MKLVIISNLNKGKTFELQEGNNLIGRWDPEDKSFPEIDLEAEDEESKISRRHCVVIQDRGSVVVEDVGSLNGTFVNGGSKLVPGQQVPIKPGDQVLVGKILLQLAE